MSFTFLPFEQDEFFNLLPSLNLVNNTLQLIQTYKLIPSRSLTCLDAQQPSGTKDEELCYPLPTFADRFEKTNLLSTPIKKKKSGCTCRKTNCLKNYCQCFWSGKQCTDQCACNSCMNSHQHTQLVKQTKQEIKLKGSRKANGGCNCRKSQCQKKYCQCFNSGLSCTSLCKCIDCQNNTPHGHQNNVSSSNVEEQKIKSSSAEQLQNIQDNQSKGCLILGVDSDLYL